MARTLETTVYTFDELSDTAKERAREWWRNAESADFDASATLEDAERVAEIIGIEFATRPVRLMGGGTRGESVVYWSGFSSQGDGACFEGTYRYAKGAAKAIRAYAPTDTRLHAIADELQAVQSKAFYRLEASMAHRGHYYHSGYMSVSVEDREDSYRDVSRFEDDITDAMRDFASWIYRQIGAEYEYAMSDENVDESIRINEYEFTESGDIV